MPKVTEEHREQRREEILAAAWKCFAQRGFHGTSMSEIINASGLSAGAVYLYFRSKEDLIRATAEKALGIAEAVIRQMDGEPVPPGVAVTQLLRAIVKLNRDTDGMLFPVALEAWSEASRNPEIQQVAREFYGQLIDGVSRLIQRWVDAGNEVSVPITHLARAAVGLVQGYVIQVAAFGGSAGPAYLDTLTSLITATMTAAKAPALVS